MTRNKKKTGRGYARGEPTIQQQRKRVLAERRAHRNWQEICNLNQDFNGQETNDSEQTGRDKDIGNLSGLVEVSTEPDTTGDGTSIQSGIISTPTQRKFTESTQETQSPSSDQRTSHKISTAERTYSTSTGSYVGGIKKTITHSAVSPSTTMNIGDHTKWSSPTQPQKLSDVHPAVKVKEELLDMATASFVRQVEDNTLEESSDNESDNDTSFSDEPDIDNTITGEIDEEIQEIETKLRKSLPTNGKPWDSFGSRKKLKKYYTDVIELQKSTDHIDSEMHDNESEAEQNGFNTTASILRGTTVVQPTKVSILNESQPKKNTLIGITGDGIEMEDEQFTDPGKEMVNVTIEAVVDDNPTSDQTKPAPPLKDDVILIERVQDTQEKNPTEANNTQHCLPVKLKQENLATATPGSHDRSDTPGGLWSNIDDYEDSPMSDDSTDGLESFGRDAPKSVWEELEMIQQEDVRTQRSPNKNTPAITATINEAGETNKHKVEPMLKSFLGNRTGLRKADLRARKVRFQPNIKVVTTKELERQNIMRTRGEQMVDHTERVTTPTKIEFNIPSSTQEVNIREGLNTLLIRMAKEDPAIRILTLDKATVVWELNEELVEAQQFADQLKMREQNFRNGSKKVALFCIVESSFTINRLKYSPEVKDYIFHHNIWIKPDLYSTQVVTCPGFFTLVHPKMTNKNEFTKDLFRLMTDLKINPSEEVVKDWHETKQLQVRESQAHVPQFHLETNSRKWGGLVTEVLSVHCTASDAKYLKYLLSELGTKQTLSKGLFIPTGIHLMEGKEVM